MYKKNNQKEKILTLRVSNNQYKKIQQLAQIREMNITEYIRNSAIGNRIKPTVIDINGHDKDKQIKNLKRELVEAKKHEETLHQFLKYVQKNGEYINISKYKNDEILKERIRESMKIFENNKLK